MNFKKIFAPAMSVILAVGMVAAPATNVFAATGSTGSVAADITNTTVVGQDTAQSQFSEYQEVSEGSHPCKVYATVPSTFTVKIPKTVILTGVSTANGATGAYSVNVQGDIGTDEQITVKPDASAAMKQTGKSDVTAIIDQAKTVFGASDIAATAGDTTTGTITATLSAGQWSGTFYFAIQCAAV